MKNWLKTSVTFWLILCGFENAVISQVTDSSALASDSLNEKKIFFITASASSLYAGSMIGLYNLWYKDYPQSTFHLINDNKEWLQIDKCGHLTSTYNLGMVGYNALRWTGLSEKKSIWYGGLTGLIYLTTVEVFDGFSEQWGASPGDVVANSLGAALFISQQLAWHEQKISIKIAFHGSPYAKYNPDQLGRSFAERMLKDYNGHTFWLSANISSFGLQNSQFPKWLNIAAGYGAEGMTAPNNNNSGLIGNPVPVFERFRQFYISPDIDLSRIPVKSKTVKLILNAIGFIKIPMPALEFNKNGVKFHSLYF